MHSVKTTFLAASAAALVTLPALAADVTIVFKGTSNGKETTSTDYFTTNKMRTSNDKTDSIIDTAAGRIVMIDNAKKEYSEMTVAELQSALQSVLAQRDEMLNNMPPQVREMMKKKMGGGAGGVTVTQGAGTRKIAGYDAQQYILTMGEGGRSELWTTTALQLPIQPGEMMRLQAMIGPMAQSMGGAMEEFKKIQGFTLASSTTIKIAMKTIESTREAVEVKTGAIPASTFEVPAGYKKVDSPLLKLGKK